jgi:hypothetical protein
MSEDEEDSIEILCPVCSQPMDASEEVAECVNPTCAVYELETGTWYAITRHIELMQKRTAELELIQLDQSLALVSLARLLKEHAPNIEPLDTLAGLVSQLDNLMTGYKSGSGTVSLFTADGVTIETDASGEPMFWTGRAVVVAGATHSAPGQSEPPAPGVHVVNVDDMGRAHFGPVVDGE